MLKHLSLKTKMFALLIFIVLLAAAPLAIYFVKTAGAFARLGADPSVERTLQAAVDRAPSSGEQQAAALSLKRFRQIEVLRETIVRQAVLVSAVYFTAVLLVALTIGYLFISRITRPLKELTRATQQLAADDLDVKLPEKAGGEIGALMHSFNAMAHNLSAARQEKMLAERKATWQRVARVIAHEIKNPLTPIKLSTERMYEKFLSQSKDFPAVIKSTVDTVLNEINTLQRLVDTFHKYAKFPDPVLRPEPVNEVIESVCSLFSFSHAPIIRNFAPDLPLIKMDKGQVREVLSNLIKNAAEAIAETGRSGEIAVSSVRDGAMVRIRVADNGCGIAPENLEKLFQPYFTTKKGGNGIGLALAERIISLHGGGISCQSRAGEGTTFDISLPC
jgi:nitrogen fixation/metabolism regulation signal transduction histidine kinase